MSHPDEGGISGANVVVDCHIRRVADIARLEQSMQRCPACDHFNLADAKTCERCGKPLPSESSSEGSLTGSASPPEDSLEARVLQTARSNGKIAAIKLWREHRGGGLKEAKEAVEALMAEYNVRAGGGSGGCGASVLLMLAALAAVLRLLAG